MKIVIEQVEIPDLLIPRKLFSPNNPDIFDIPDSLYERWEKVNADFWSVQTELNRTLREWKTISPTHSD